MIEAVFISDLHLHPEEKAITERFKQFIVWAQTHTKAVYILGDFFHVWPGDDALDEWSHHIATQLASLKKQGVALFFMPGNRDFLLGERFAKLADMVQLSEPTVIVLGDERILLVHGDRYCTRDKGHQWLRKLTRNRWFPVLFLKLSLSLRARLVNTVRNHSQSNRSKPSAWMDVVAVDLLHHMVKSNVNIVVHGHTHQPGLTIHEQGRNIFKQYILSDWDDNPTLLCYDKSEGLYFDPFQGALL